MLTPYAPSSIRSGRVYPRLIHFMRRVWKGAAKRARQCFSGRLRYTSIFGLNTRVNYMQLVSILVWLSKGKRLLGIWFRGWYGPWLWFWFDWPREVGLIRSDFVI